MSWIALLLFILLCLAAGGVGYALSIESLRSWYPSLKKPPWNPHDYVFGKVWNVLYCVIAVSVWLIWSQHDSPGRTQGLLIFWIQLALNVGWSACFFKFRSPFLGLLCIWLLDVAVFGMIFDFWPLNPWAAILLLPYLAWICFATALNYEILRLNESEDEFSPKNLSH